MYSPNFRAIVLGDHIVHKDPDCPASERGGVACTRNVTRSVGKLIIHEDYEYASVSPHNDIALIRLNEPVTLYDDDLTPRSGAKPVCLPWPSIEEEVLRDIENLNNDEKVVVTGWGRTTNRRRLENKKLIRNKIAEKHLLYLQTKTASDLCKEKLEGQADINTDIQLCAGGDEGT